jgi:hypothetical protein
MGVAYVPFMFGLWLMLFGATVALAARIVRSRVSHRRGTQPPLVDLVRAGAGSSG